MSVCNLGRPPRDAAVQNLTVNDTLRSNKLLKANKAEINRLCASIEEVKQSNILFIGSLSVTTGSEGTLPLNYTLYDLPSGIRDVGDAFPVLSTPGVSRALYTDVDLVVRKLQVTLTTSSQSRDDVHNVDFSIYSGATPVTGTNLVTLSLLNTNAVDVRETDTSSIAIIPAGSYYSILISEGAGSTTNTITNLRASWTIELIPRV
jgi:hypothetical protein